MTRSVVAIAAMLLLVIVGGLSRRRARPAERAVVPAARAGADARTGILGVEAIVTPPPYVEAGPQQVTDPSRIDALAGSTVTLRIATTAAAAAISYAGTTHTPAIQGQAATVALRLDASGGLGIDARDRAGTVVDRRLIPIVVRPDAPPQVSIEEPGKDLVLASAADPVRFAVRASDDLALASLTLHYTRVTGSGEQYQFDEGRLAMAVSRERRDRWLGAAAPRLAGLGLQPGDLLVVYAQAADRRPGAAAVVSDSYVIEIGKAQAAISGGFAVPTEEDRAAISLSALIQKTERLHATRAQLGASVLAEQSAALAVEQRMVRTETLFLMGAHGEVEDEEAEAEHSNEIQEGRLENRGQADLRTATRLMSAAERSLLLTDTGGALPPQRAALAAMQRALSKQRYFLRTLPVRSRIDPTRRLSGDLSEASGWARRGDRPPPDRSLTAIRAALADLDRLHRIDRLDASAATDLAARVLALDPASAALQHAASGLMALSKGGADRVRRREALTVVAVALEGLAAAVPAAPSASPSSPRRRCAVRSPTPGDSREAGRDGPRPARAARRRARNRRPRLARPVVRGTRSDGVAVVDHGSTRTLATLVHDALAPGFEVVSWRDPSADAWIVVAEDEEAEVPLLPPGVALSLVVPASSARAVRLERLDAPARVAPHTRARLSVTLAARGLEGMTARVAARVGTLEMGHIDHRVTRPDERFTARFDLLLPHAGVNHVTVEAPGGGAAGPDDRLSRAGVAIVVDAHPVPVLVFEARPSWTTTFARRGLEQDARFAIVAMSRVSRRIDVTSIEGARAEIPHRQGLRR